MRRVRAGRGRSSGITSAVTDQDRPYRDHSERELFEMSKNLQRAASRANREKNRMKQIGDPDYHGVYEHELRLGEELSEINVELTRRREDRQRRREQRESRRTTADDSPLTIDIASTQLRNTRSGELRRMKGELERVIRRIDDELQRRGHS